MKPALTLITALLLTPLAALHAEKPARPLPSKSCHKSCQAFSAMISTQIIDFQYS